MGSGFFGGGSASQTNSSGQQQVQLDPVVRDFVNNYVIGNFKNLTGDVLTGDKSFIPDQSADTQSFYNSVRGLDPTGANSGTITDFLKNYIQGGGVGAAPISATGYTTYDPSATGYTTYDPTSADAYGYDAAQVAARGPVSVGQGAAFSSPYFDQYRQEVVNSALDTFDQGAGMGFQAMRAGRDAGSAFGDRTAQADGKYWTDAARARAGVAAPILSQAFQFASTQGQSDAERAAAAAMQDAVLSAHADETNATFKNSAASQLAAARNNASLFNAGAANTAGQFNTAAANNALAANANAANAAGQFNTGAANNALQFNAAAQNQGAQFNSSLAMQNLVQQMAAGQQLAGMDATGWQQTLQKIGLLGQSGSAQDAFSSAKASEPLDLILRAASIAGGVPYGTNTTSSGKSTSKGATFGYGK